jgi:hypothetical protein
MMGQWVRGKVLDFTSPGWRERPLMARILADQERIRKDPKVQAIRKEVHRESVRFVRVMSTGFLLLPIVLWFIYTWAIGMPDNSGFKEFAVRMYAVWVVGVAIIYGALTADRR